MHVHVNTIICAYICEHTLSHTHMHISFLVVKALSMRYVLLTDFKFFTQSLCPVN